MSSSAPNLHAIRAARTVALAAFVAGAVGAAEFGALHLAYERPTPMKRLEATVHLARSEPDPSAIGDRELSCAVSPTGRKGDVPARGELRLTLGSTASGAAWESGAIAREVDGRGEATFAADEIAALADEAPNGASADLFTLHFTGGKGKKVTTLTIDCTRREAR